MHKLVEPLSEKKEAIIITQESYAHKSLEEMTD